MLKLKTWTKSIFIIILFLFSMCKISMTAFAAVPTQFRISGEDRYKTAVEVSKSVWQTSKNVVIASGENFPDALCAAPLAKQINAPILLTAKMDINLDTEKEIERLKAQSAIIIGGPGVIDEGIVEKLKKKGIACNRLYGSDRYSTSIAVANHIISNFKTEKQIVVAEGEDFPDALSISSIAAAKSMPIILVPKDSLPGEIKKFLSEKGITKSYIIGGRDIISDSVSDEFLGAERITGSNRYERNINIIKAFEKSINFDTVYVATGENYPDALAGSVLASMTSSPIILTPEYPSQYIRNFVSLKLSDIKRMGVFGGEGALSNAAVERVISLNNDKPSVISISNISDIGQLVAGSGLVLTPKALDSDGRIISGASFTYTSSNPDIVLVDQYGHIKSVSPGRAFITIKTKNTASDISVKIAVRVVDSKGSENNVYSYIYNDIYLALENLEDEVDLSRYQKSSPDVFSILNAVLEGHPEIFYVDYKKAAYWSNGKLELGYEYEKDIIKAMKKELDNKIYDVLNACISSDMMDFEKEKAVHDYIVLSTVYDGDSIKDNTTFKMSSNVYGSLIYKMGASEGYSASVKMLLNRSGIECISVTSQEAALKWNMVRIDGKWYGVDAVHNDSLPDKGRISYKYYNLSDVNMSKYHKWDKSKYPLCDSERFSYMNDIAEICQSDGFIYYSSISDNDALYKIRLDGKLKQKICSDRAFYICVYGDYVYYSNYSYSEFIYKIKKDGTGRQQVNSTPSGDLYINNGMLYYKDSKSKIKYSIKIES